MLPTYHPNRRLSKAAYNGDNAAITSLLESTQADVNFINPNNHTPLYLATIRKFSDTVSLLLGFGAKPDIPDLYGNTPLMMAAHWNNPESTCLLLQANASLHARNHQKYTVLMQALKGSAGPQTLEYLLRALYQAFTQQSLVKIFAEYLESFILREELSSGKQGFLQEQVQKCFEGIFKGNLEPNKTLSSSYTISEPNAILPIASSSVSASLHSGATAVPYMPPVMQAALPEAKPTVFNANQASAAPAIMLSSTIPAMAKAIVLPNPTSIMQAISVTKSVVSHTNQASVLTAPPSLHFSYLVAPPVSSSSSSSYSTANHDTKKKQKRKRNKESKILDPNQMQIATPRLLKAHS